MTDKLIDRLLDDIDLFRARLEAAENDARQLAEALEKQRDAREGCFCLLEDYKELVEEYGEDHVRHSPYCRVATAALEKHSAIIS